ncbi:hypothetical protein [Deinococcus sp. SL84]|uniref:hypothetical protein n=1 Tax=Deinococcus sp. SL84 TaxID=2994663 RepID=UPI002274C063|nr:hypothetical protein [Deinococcus sp. SL84]MCY1704001.1 hypothetical protein [Deinococcus sp. SL84]
MHYISSIPLDEEHAGNFFVDHPNGKWTGKHAASTQPQVFRDPLNAQVHQLYAGDPVEALPALNALLIRQLTKNLDTLERQIMGLNRAIRRLPELRLPEGPWHPALHALAEVIVRDRDQHYPDPPEVRLTGYHVLPSTRGLSVLNPAFPDGRQDEPEYQITGLYQERWYTGTGRAHSLIALSWGPTPELAWNNIQSQLGPRLQEVLDETVWKRSRTIWMLNKAVERQGKESEGIQTWRWVS